MQILIISVIAVFFAICSGTILIALFKSTKKQGKSEQELVDLHNILSIKDQSFTDYKNRNSELEIKLNDLIVKKTEAETKLQSLQNTLEKYEFKINELAKERDFITEEKNKYYRERELAIQREQTALKEKRNWEETNKQTVEFVKASILEAGSQLSNKLLDDHKRESVIAKKENENAIIITTKHLNEKFQNVIETMSHLHENVKKSNKDYEIINRSLLSPTGAGILSEITLENILKNSGLIQGIDYQIQYNVKNYEGNNLRPDAVVFLPSDNVMVIDSKSSKFFLELGMNELDQNKDKELKAALKKSINDNLKGLASRDYSKSIELEVGKSLAHVYMFLPTESALEQIRIIDPTFMSRAWSQGIFPVGPTGLVNELLRAGMQISNAKQEENTKLIIEKVKELLNGIAILNTHADGIGKGLKSALDKYDRFAASFNANFMSKAKNISNLGVSNSKLQSIEPLQKYNVTALNIKEVEADIIEDTDKDNNVKLELLG